MAVALTLLGTLPLAWRERQPVAVALAPLAPLVAGIGSESLALMATAVIGLYSVAAFRPARVAIAVLIAAAAAAAASVLQDDGNAGDLLFAGFVVGAPWAAGRLARRLGLHAREAERRAREAAAEERVRIARELHDIVAHSVSVMVAQAGGAETVVESDPERARDAMRAVRETGQLALVEMRRMVGLLRGGDATLGVHPQPTLAELDALIDHARDAGLHVDLRVDGAPRPLPPGVDLSAYRILQEALTNARRRGGATAHVTVRWDRKAIELAVENDGPAGTVNGDGHGLVGMRERAALYGGTREAGPRKGGGFTVRATLPAEES